PDDGAGANELTHQADLAVYRAKLQGRNRVLAASAESHLLTKSEGQPAFLPGDMEQSVPMSVAVPGGLPSVRVPRDARRARQLRFFSRSLRMGLLVAL